MAADEKRNASEAVEETMTWKAERFFGRNWMFVFGAVTLAFLTGTYDIHQLGKRMSSLEDTVRDNNNKVVMTTIDGRAIKVEKTPLKAEDLKKFVASTVVNNMIVSRAGLTNNFKIDNFKKFSDVLERSKGLGLIYTDFIDKEDKQKIGYLTAYLNWILDAMAKDKLSEYVNISDYKFDVYTFDKNTFHAELSIFVVTQNYMIAQGQYVPKNGVIKIAVDGNFNLENSTDVNPYGLRFDSLKIEMPTKV